MDQARPISAPDSAAGLGSAPAVPDYELLQQIGRGAYGDVWLARSKATGALRAAKIVWRHRFEDERPFQREFEGIQRFERIAREHPTQLALFHVGRNEAEGYFYYVMELADDLGERSNGRLEDRSDASGAKNRRSADPLLQDTTSYVPHTLRADLENGRLPAKRVLEIGLALAEALGHLHSHGLVHRDVKPSNVISGERRKFLWNDLLGRQLI
jgi:serine/threonine protein kinase